MSQTIRIFYQLLFILSFNALSGQFAFEDSELIFNGKDLSNWTVEPKQENIWWAIKSGILAAKSDKEETGSTLWTIEEYEDFAMTLDFKMGEGVVDSGVFLRGENAQSPQIQIGISGSLKVDMTASPYVPKMGYPVKADVSEALKNNQWNTMTILAVKNNFKVWLNNQKVLEYNLENSSLSGPIGLQLHPNRTMQIQFKDIYLKKL